MGVTAPPWSLPYPEATDPADVPADIHQLCDQLQTLLPGFQLSSGKGAANGYAALDATGKVPAAQIPPPAAVADTAKQLAYAELTTNVPVTGTTEAAATTIVSAPATGFDGTPCWIEFYAPSFTPAGTNANVFCLYQDGSSIGQLGQVITPTSALVWYPVHLRRRMTPSSGTHTYSIRAFCVTAGGVVQADTGGSGLKMPGYILITKA